jgi:hypothetical protein
VGAVHLASKHLDHLISEGSDRNIEVRGLFQRADHGAELGADQLLEQRLLVGEVQVDRALGDAGAPRNIVEAGGGEAAGGKLLQRRRKDGVPPFSAAFGTRAALLSARGRGRGRLSEWRWSRRNFGPRGTGQGNGLVYD